MLSREGTCPCCLLSSSKSSCFSCSRRFLFCFRRGWSQLCTRADSNTSSATTSASTNFNNPPHQGCGEEGRLPALLQPVGRRGRQRGRSCLLWGMRHPSWPLWKVRKMWIPMRRTLWLWLRLYPWWLLEPRFWILSIRVCSLLLQNYPRRSSHDDIYHFVIIISSIIQCSMVCKWILSSTIVIKNWPKKIGYSAHLLQVLPSCKLMMAS